MAIFRGDEINDELAPARELVDELLGRAEKAEARAPRSGFRRGATRGVAGVLDPATEESEGTTSRRPAARRRMETGRA